MTTTDTSLPTSSPSESYTRAGLDQLTDVELVAHTAATLRVPRENPADSFVLHAPLELVARAALLPRVRPDRRAAARVRIHEVGEQFTAAGAPLDGAAPVGPLAFDSVDAGGEELIAAIDAGDLDRVDEVAGWLGRSATPVELRRLLAGDVQGRLSAAAHASIFLYQLPRISPRGEVTGELVRGLARELARYPDWRLHWTNGLAVAAGPATPASADAMFDALASTPALGPPDSTFIFPLMASVDASGVAQSVLGDVAVGTDVAGRSRAVLRAAAWSMLLEPPDHAPYGWSHCLTLPQAVLGIAPSTGRPDVALAVAATYVVGFRAALAEHPLEPVFALADPHLPLGEAIEAGPDPAAAAAWHAPAGTTADLVTELVTRAATHHDAHFVKYTLACLDAAADDPAHRRLFLAAAARLAGVWAQSP